MADCKRRRGDERRAQHATSIVPCAKRQDKWPIGLNGDRTRTVCLRGGRRAPLPGRAQMIPAARRACAPFPEAPPCRGKTTAARWGGGRCVVEMAGVEPASETFVQRHLRA